MCDASWNNFFPFFFFWKLDKSVISAIATNDESAKNKSLVKIWCVTETNVVSIMLNSLSSSSGNILLICSWHSLSQDCEIRFLNEYFFAAEKEWKQFNVVFAPLKPRMSYQWWAWPGCFRYHAGPCLSELVVWSQAFYSFHIQMPLTPILLPTPWKRKKSAI